MRRRERIDGPQGQNRLTGPHRARSKIPRCRLEPLQLGLPRLPFRSIALEERGSLLKHKREGPPDSPGDVTHGKILRVNRAVNVSAPLLRERPLEPDLPRSAQIRLKLAAELARATERSAEVSAQKSM